MHSRNTSVGISSSSGAHLSPASHSSDTWNLVRALINFGRDDCDEGIGRERAVGHGAQQRNELEDDPERHSDLDNEDEEITVAGVKALSLHSTAKGKQRQANDTEQLTSSTGTTGLASKEEKPTKAAVSRSIRSLLRSAQHTITLPPAGPGGQPIVRTLTSWKMADYAYKRDPCPFPTRARGLFTERINPARDEYRIVARGYDKFFNVNEVSWTHVSAESDSF
jgi:tRNA ligase